MEIDEEQDRLTGPGRQLIETHARLPQALDDLRDGGSPPRLPVERCLASCAAVTQHHSEEDTSVFPLPARHPELRDVLAGDHRAVAATPAPARDLDADGARRELDGLAAPPASHFAEERRLVAALHPLLPDTPRPRW